MGLFDRLFANDLRDAVAAEAAGKFELAAEKYGKAGHRAGAVRMHLARANAAASSADEMNALRAALHWAGDDKSLSAEPSARLGRILYTELERAGIATQRDRDRVRQAADLLLAGGDFLRAGQALTAIGDTAAAATAFSSGGHVDEMEAALAADASDEERARTERNAFANYQTNLQVGRRDDARSDLREALAVATQPGTYQRLLHDLETALITGSRVELATAGQPLLVLLATPQLTLGRDPLCEFPLRATSISRAHCQIDVAVDDDVETPAFLVRDLGSRNGTRWSGLPISDRLPLRSDGDLTLATDCELAVSCDESIPQLRLRVTSGIDRGRTLVVTRPGARIDLNRDGLPLVLVFADGRAYVTATRAGIRINQSPLGTDVRFQLMRGDVIGVEQRDVEVR